MSPGGTSVPDIMAADGSTIPDIQDSVGLESQPRDFLERYYECRYVLDHRQPGHDYRLLFHSNGLIVVMLAPSHPLVAGGATVTDINFQVTEHTNRLENKVSGKGKRGAQLVTQDAPLFAVTCADGTRHVVRACVRGKLVQLNERLGDEPQLLVTDSGGKGFVALILPKLGQSRTQMKGTLTPDEYAERRTAANGANKTPEEAASEAVGDWPEKSDDKLSEKPQEATGDKPPETAPDTTVAEPAVAEVVQ